MASDSFKRSAVNWGIGRELYTSPFIWITNKQCDIKLASSGNYITNATFSVASIDIVDKKIIHLTIVNDRTGEVVFEWERTTYENAIGKDKLDTIKNLNVDPEKAKEVLKSFGYEKSSDIRVKDFTAVFKKLKGIAE